MSMSSYISIGCECGGPAAQIVGQRKVPLYQALSRAVSSTFCSAIDEYALVIRADGSLARYGAEGVAKLRFAKTKRYITVDLQIPESVWKPLTPSELDAYLANLVVRGLEACIARLEVDGHHVHKESLMAEVQRGVAEYLQPSSRSAAR
jgi:hypothetical protein